MSYINDNLLPNEQIIHQGRVHWSIFVWSIISIILGLLLLTGTMGILGYIFIAVGLIHLVRAVLMTIGTELAITNVRVIAKFGVISRNTTELNLSQMEGLRVNQGIWGRLFDYGTVILSGTGAKAVTIPYIIQPLTFRKAAYTQAEKSHEKLE